jgi:alpha-galactosidase
VRGQEKTQFALWAIFAAPLLMSNDLRNVPEASRQVLLNTEIIAVNQDPLGRQGRKTWQNGACVRWLGSLFELPVSARGVARCETCA